MRFDRSIVPVSLLLVKLSVQSIVCLIVCLFSDDGGVRRGELYGSANDPGTANDPGPQMIPILDRK